MKKTSKKGNESRPDIREQAAALQRRFRDFPVPPPVVDGEVKKVEPRKLPGRPVQGTTRRDILIPVRFNVEELAALMALKEQWGITEDSEAIRKAIALCFAAAKPSE